MHRDDHTTTHQPLPPLLGPAEIAGCLGIAKRTLQTWIALGRFPGADLRVGKTRRWRRQTLERWLNSQNAAAAG